MVLSLFSLFSAQQKKKKNYGNRSDLFFSSLFCTATEDMKKANPHNFFPGGFHHIFFFFSLSSPIIVYLSGSWINWEKKLVSIPSQKKELVKGEMNQATRKKKVDGKHKNEMFRFSLFSIREAPEWSNNNNRFALLFPLHFFLWRKKKDYTTCWILLFFCPCTSLL